MEDMLCSAIVTLATSETWMMSPEAREMGIVSRLS